MPAFDHVRAGDIKKLISAVMAEKETSLDHQDPEDRAESYLYLSQPPGSAPNDPDVTASINGKESKDSPS